MSIVHVSSLNNLSTILEGAKSQLVVIDFHATWCGPCHQIAPRYEHLAKTNPQVHFLKCDVDAAQDVARHYKVSAMPTLFSSRMANRSTWLGVQTQGVSNPLSRSTRASLLMTRLS
ncbi:thioredoxin [Rhizoctonia solani AG-3 Rhs1AP]|uniref:Thioredoxin n=1 Tax=Rhizoctonia solani AG-3 Rhs1AP TaxID=1086054 RepID=X8JBK9_9AGAM|nr:thioredoxin [Rhizoctonia solani AG-3 Rhs1AP]